MRRYHVNLLLCVGLLAFCGTASAAASSPTKESKREKVSAWLSRVWGDITGAKGGTQEEGDDTIVVSSPSSPEKGLEQKERVDTDNMLKAVLIFNETGDTFTPRDHLHVGVPFGYAFYPRGLEISNFNEDDFREMLMTDQFRMTSNMWPLFDDEHRPLSKEHQMQFEPGDDRSSPHTVWVHFMSDPEHDEPQIVSSDGTPRGILFYRIRKAGPQDELESSAGKQIDYVIESYKISDETKKAAQEGGLPAEVFPPYLFGRKK